MAFYTPGLLDQDIHLTLDRYAEIMRLAPAAFNGLFKADESTCFPCAAIWKQYDRDAMAMMIGQAEEMREQELGYHLAPAYDYDEEGDYLFPVVLKKKFLIDVGVPAIANIALNVALTLSVGGVINDPVSVTVATTVTDVDEICLFYVGTDVPIHPSSVVISGGNVTIEIPRSRLISLDVDTNCEPPPNYDDDRNFDNAIDIKRCYHTYPGVHFVWFGDCNSFCIPNLTETLQDGFARIMNKRLSIVELYPASYSGGTWTPSAFSKCCSPCRVRVTYKSGKKSSIATEILTSRLAHTLLAEFIPFAQNPCGQCWKDDRKVDPSGIVTPYGTSVGAVMAWMADSRAKVGAGGTFPKVR